MSQLQNQLIQSIFQANAQEEEPGFSMVLDPEVRKRLNLENPRVKGKSKEAPPMPMDPIAMQTPIIPALQKFSVGSGTISSPEDRARHQDAYIQFKDLMARQDQGLEEQEATAQTLREQNNAARFNPAFVAAANMGDAIYGGNQGEGASRWAGASPEERTALLQKMQADMNSQRANQSAQYKSLISEGNNLRIADMASKNNRAAQGMDMRLNMAFNKDVQAANKIGFETLQQVQPIEAALEMDANGMVDYARVTQALANASRLMGERGVLTDQDIERVQRKTIDSQIASVTGWMTSNPGQPVPAAVVAPLRAAIADGKASMQRLMKMKLDGIQNAYVNGYGLRPEVAQAVLQGPQGYQTTFQQGFAPSQTAPAQGAIDKSGKPLMTREEFMKSRGK